MNANYLLTRQLEQSLKIEDAPKFKVYWREYDSGSWDFQETFKTRYQAHAWISEQPDGGFYKVREE